MSQHWTRWLLWIPVWVPKTLILCTQQTWLTQHSEFHCKVTKPLLLSNHKATLSGSSSMLLPSEQQIPGDQGFVYVENPGNPGNFLTNRKKPLPSIILIFPPKPGLQFYTSTLLTTVTECVDYIRKSWLTHITLFTKKTPRLYFLVVLNTFILFHSNAYNMKLSIMHDCLVSFTWFSWTCLLPFSRAIRVF